VFLIKTSLFFVVFNTAWAFFAFSMPMFENYRPRGGWARFDLALLFDPCYWNFRVLGCHANVCTTISLKIFRVRKPNFQESFRVDKINCVWNFFTEILQYECEIAKKVKVCLFTPTSLIFKHFDLKFHRIPTGVPIKPWKFHSNTLLESREKVNKPRVGSNCTQCTAS